ncbi:SBBP repeat-containing protein [Acanthopleuribacter pedis]|uniref:SBBP repeat-containing protein n=1 Tax=Acanthopleuribacter pedis TaxID=442870 RepID=A0A8J7QQS3_9BACT|nr:SBBP repeat-containing protein [Acanthopleuribacter pedis]MBO1322465.1 SBBP repeat-containing protein [Acanthopleuribacter pedis]
MNHFMFKRVAMMVLGFVFLLGHTQATPPASELHLFAKASNFFVPNHRHETTGKRLVADDAVVAFAQTRRGRVLFTPGGAFVAARTGPDDRNGYPGTLDVAAPKRRTAVFQVGFAASQVAKGTVKPRLVEPSEVPVNFLTGPSTNWQTGVTTYQKLIYDQVWEGIHVEYLAGADRLNMRLVLEPFADLNQVHLETGAVVATTEEGGLEAALGDAVLQGARPIAYQIIDGRRVTRAAVYRAKANGAFGFVVPDADPAVALVLEPTLSWSSYLGGDGGFSTERGTDVALDAAGNTYIIGYTGTADFPTTAGAFNQSWSGDEDVFVAKLNPGGTEVMYATYLGGLNADRGIAVALDGDQAVILGHTESPEFPTTVGAFERTHKAGTDLFVAKLNATGSALVFSTFLGGYRNDEARDLALDAKGRVLITGGTTSQGFPTTENAFDPSFNGIEDAFVAKLDADGASLLFSTFLGGAAREKAYAVAVDAAGNTYVAGETASENFPTTADAYGTEPVGSYDGFVAKLNSTGTELLAATFLGGSETERCTGIAVGAGGAVTVVGTGRSPDLPTTAGAFDTQPNGGLDAFVVRLNPSCTGLIYATLLGGERSDRAGAVHLDERGNAFIFGETYSPDFPATEGAYDVRHNGNQDLFLAKLSNDGAQLIYATYLGGEGNDYAGGAAFDPAGNATLVGYSSSDNYPTTTGVLGERRNGLADVVVTRLNATGSDLLFSTYIGGSGYDEGQALALDGEGAVYVAGNTFSDSFPTTGGVVDQTYNGDFDVFVGKMTPEGDRLLYATYLGGGRADSVHGITVDGDGNAYLTGITYSANFPTTAGAFETGYNQYGDLFVAKLNPGGTALAYSTFLGGYYGDSGRAIAVDGMGQVTVTGSTHSADFPVTEDALDDSFDGNEDAFVARFNATGSTLIYSTFLGGEGGDSARALALDENGNMVIAGSTDSAAFPVTAGAYDTTHNGGSDIFVVKMNAEGSALNFSSYLGGEGSDTLGAMVRDPAGNLYVTGNTTSSDFPVTAAAFDPTQNGYTDAFVAKFNSAGTAVAYATYLGGQRDDRALGIDVTEAGHAVITGTTYSETFPVSHHGFSQSLSGSHDAFLVTLDETGSALNYGSYLGGPHYEEGRAVVLSDAGYAYVTGYTESSIFPTTAGAYDETPNGAGNAFVARLNLSAPNQPGSVSGPEVVCFYQRGVVYAVPPVPRATEYLWRIPADATLARGAGTNRIMVHFGEEGGEIGVRAINAYGAGPEQTTQVLIKTAPPMPEPISGPTEVCARENNLVYSIPAVAGADGYLWRVPRGARIISGWDTNQVTLRMGENSGMVAVYATSDCGVGPKRELPVRVTGLVPASSPRDTRACFGDSVNWSVTLVGDKPATYQWFKDGVPLTGATASRLTLHEVDASDAGFYHCEVRDDCGSVTTRSARLSLSNLAGIVVAPGAQALGVNPPRFEAYSRCPLGALSYDWSTDPSTPFVATGNSIQFDPAPLETTRILLTVTHEDTQERATVEAWLLVPPNTGFEDVNGDGCNSITDLWELLPSWRQTLAGDPNADGLVNVLDFLFIPLTGPTPCP